MIEQGGGAIVNIASVNAFFQPDAGTIDYGAAKAGVVNLTKSLAQEFGPQRHPRELRLARAGQHRPLARRARCRRDRRRGDAASTRTPRAANVVASIGGFATGRFTTPEEVATLVVLLASDRHRQRDRRELRHRRRPDQDDVAGLTGREDDERAAGVTAIRRAWDGGTIRTGTWACCATRARPIRAATT